MHVATGTRNRGVVMDSQEILSLYEWTSGVCFRHPSLGETSTATVTTLHPRGADDDIEVRACRACVLDMEAARERAAARAGAPYRPGPAQARE